MAIKPKAPLAMVALRHDDTTRKNIATVKYHPVMNHTRQSPMRCCGLATKVDAAFNNMIGSFTNEN